ncbi:MAG TPA: type II secretion system F family protein [Actinomycetota bacterium]|nr:type II secretion system F family protein [Actinomycetota bacterium]
MSETAYLVFALIGTFAAVVLLGVALDFSVSDRKRAVRLLEAQVRSGAESAVPANLRDQELSQSFAERALLPVVTGAGRLAKRVTPIGAAERYTKKLQLAGSPAGWDAERIAAFKIIGGVVGFVLGVVLITAVEFSTLTRVLIIVVLTAVGFFGPDGILDSRVQARQRGIRRQLPDVLDLLTISVEAGLSLNAALGQVVGTVPGTLSMEVARMLQEIQLGVPRSDAFRHLGERTDVDELNGFVLAMIQADIFGVPIANVLRAQAKDLRVKRRQRAQEQAQQTPVKMTFPLILCILPSLFVVIVGPGAIRIMGTFLGQ